MRWGYGKPPPHAGFAKGQSGNRAGGRLVQKPVELNDTLNEPVTITGNGRRRKITKRQVVTSNAKPSMRTSC